MSFKRKGPGVVASTAIGVLAGAALVGGVVGLLALPSFAQTSNSAAQVSGEFERPFGRGYGQERAAHAPDILVGASSAVGNSALFVTTQTGS